MPHDYALVEDAPLGVLEQVGSGHVAGLTAEEVATLLSVDRSTVGQWIRDGRLVAQRVTAPVPGGVIRSHYVVTQEAVSAFVARQRSGVEAETKKRRDMQRMLTAQCLPDGELPHDLVEAVGYHQQLLTRSRRTEASKRAYRVYLGQMLLFLEERGIEPRLDVLTPRLAGECVDWMRCRHNSARAHQGGAAAEAVFVLMLKGFARALTEHDVYAVDPLVRLKRVRPPKPNRAPYTDAELSAMLEAAAAGKSPARDRALLLLLLDTGCRIGELCAADVGDVDLARGSIVFRRTKNGQPRQVLFGVGEDGGPCLIAARDWLTSRQVTASSPLFTGNAVTGRPRLEQVGSRAIRRRREPSAEPRRLTPAGALRIVIGIGRAAGVDKPMCHRFRHTSATQFLSRRPGAEIQLRSRLGHLSDAVLANYVHMTEAMAEDGAQVASISSRLVAPQSAAVGPRGRRQTLKAILGLLDEDPGLGYALLQVLTLTAAS